MMRPKAKDGQINSWKYSVKFFLPFSMSDPKEILVGVKPRPKKLNPTSLEIIPGIINDP